jgi:hypothetical protein
MFVLTRLHAITTQKPVISLFTALRTSNIILLIKLQLLVKATSLIFPLTSTIHGIHFSTQCLNMYSEGEKKISVKFHVAIVLKCVFHILFCVSTITYNWGSSVKYKSTDPPQTNNNVNTFWREYTFPFLKTFRKVVKSCA